MYFSKMFIMSVSDIRQRLNGAAGMMNAHLITNCMPVKAEFALESLYASAVKNKRASMSIFPLVNFLTLATSQQRS